MEEEIIKNNPNKANKMTVSSGDFENVQEKQRFNKQIILGFLSKGVNKKASADMAGITEQTFYNYCKDDPEFKEKVESCLGGHDDITAQVNISRAIRAGDVAASERYLKNKRHYEKRYDPKWMDPKLIETTKNPVTGILDVYTDYDEISDSLLGEGFEPDQDSALDEMEQMLLAQDEKAEDFIKELMDEE